MKNKVDLLSLSHHFDDQIRSLAISSGVVSSDDVVKVWLNLLDSSCCLLEVLHSNGLSEFIDFSPSQPSVDRSSRSRNFATVVYPDFAPNCWDQIISDSNVPAFISPLHNMDEFSTGEPKKLHFHVLLMYPSIPSFDSVVSFIKSFGGVVVEPVSSIRAYARYLCHLDNPEKHLYDPDSVLSFSGADYSAVIS